MAARVQPIREGARSFKVRSNIGEELLAVAFIQMQQDGVLDYVFWQKPPTLREFLNWCYNPSTVIIGCFMETAGPTLDAEPAIELAGLGWVTSVRTRNGRRYADVSEMFWRKFQTLDTTLTFGKLMLDFAFEELKVDILYGITPEKNRAAVWYMRKIGFQPFGPIPGLCCWRGEECGGIMSVLTKDAWQAAKLQEAKSDDPL